jgi:hypothetical protein
MFRAGDAARAGFAQTRTRDGLAETCERCIWTTLVKREHGSQNKLF